MALIRARHEVFGVCRVGEAKVRLHPDEWTPLEPLPELPSLEDVPAEGDPQTAPALGDESEGAAARRPAVPHVTAAATDTED